MIDRTPETSRTRSDAGAEERLDVADEPECPYINEGDAPVERGPEWYAGRARTWCLVSAALAVVHLVLTIIDINQAV